MYYVIEKYMCSIQKQIILSLYTLFYIIKLIKLTIYKYGKKLRKKKVWSKLCRVYNEIFSKINFLIYYH
jgi:hypothetical protein